MIQGRSRLVILPKHFLRVCLGIVSLIAISCGASGIYVWVDEAPDTMFNSPAETILSSGDVVNVRVFGQDSLSVRERVRNDGVLALPLIGDMAVLGKTPAIVAKDVAQRLQPYVNEPHVTVVVEETHRRVTVIGEVRRPGTVDLDESAGMFDALALAGGLSEFASESRIFVLRRAPTGTFRIRFDYAKITRGEGRAALFPLRHGDQIVVE